MKNNFEQVYNSFLTMPSSEMKDLAWKSLDAIKKSCQELGFSPNSHIKLVAGIVEMFLKEDHFIFQKEKEFIKDVFTKTEYEEEIASVLSDNKDQGILGWDVIIDKLPNDAKDAVCMLGMCLIASDRRITPEEKELFEKIYR